MPFANKLSEAITQITATWGRVVLGLIYLFAALLYTWRYLVQSLTCAHVSGAEEQRICHSELHHIMVEGAIVIIGLLIIGYCHQKWFPRKGSG